MIDNWLDTFKLNVFNTFHEVGMVGVLIDPAVVGVEVPEQLRESARVLLHLGNGLQLPELSVESECVKVVLRYDGTPVPIVFPWAAVIALGIVGSEMFCQFHGQVEKPKPEPVGRGPFMVIDGGMKN